MSRLLLVAALAACSAPSRPPPELPDGELARPSSMRHCPAFTGMDLIRPWMSELFAACPSPAYGLMLPICDGPCPPPCKTTVEAGGMRPGWGGAQTFVHDERGRFRSSTRDGKPGLTCTWEGDRLATCTEHRGEEPITARATRDAAGRLTSVTARDETLAVTRDALGTVTAIDLVPFTYDASGQLVAVGDTTITYDDDGFPAAEQDGADRRTFTFDHGRLVRFTLSPTRSLSFTYDAAGRLSTLRSGGTMEDDVTYTHFHYDCR